MIDISQSTTTSAKHKSSKQGRADVWEKNFDIKNSSTSHLKKKKTKCTCNKNIDSKVFHLVTEI